MSKPFAEQEKFTPFNTGDTIYEKTSPYPNEDVGYNWLSVDYPFKHKHLDCYEILLVTNGVIINNVSNQDIIMHQGDFSLHGFNAYHAIKILEKNSTNHLSFLLKRKYFDEIIAVYGQKTIDSFKDFDEKRIFKLSDFELRKITNTIIAIEKSSIALEDKISQLKIVINLLMNNIVQNVNDFYENVPDWYLNFIFTLQNPYLKYEKIEDLAELTPYSYSHLAVRFKEIAKTNINDYIAKVKIKEAKALLKTTDLTIQEITYKLGFESASHFIKLFKRHNETTPHQYRIKNKKR
ncbi:MAG: helix-turn-helix transcriptional regulator [Bacilli bacterium]